MALKRICESCLTDNFTNNPLPKHPTFGCDICGRDQSSFAYDAADLNPRAGFEYPGAALATKPEDNPLPTREKYEAELANHEFRVTHYNPPVPATLLKRVIIGPMPADQDFFDRKSDGVSESGVRSETVFGSLMLFTGSAVLVCSENETPLGMVAMVIVPPLPCGVFVRSDALKIEKPHFFKAASRENRQEILNNVREIIGSEFTYSTASRFLMNYATFKEAVEAYTNFLSRG
jgi:hypothetical protein